MGLSWPLDAHVAREPNVANLILLAHPKCACTAATLEELDRMLAATARSPKVHVLFYRPAGVPSDWEGTSLWERASAIPGVDVLADVAGSEAKRFGAHTSGQVLLYDASGHLLFSGGITGARGHEGENPGQQAVLDWINGRPGALATAPVYGCHLFSETVDHGLERHENGEL
jgi:hypothetical protein